MPDSDHSAFSSGLPFTRLGGLAMAWVMAALMFGCKPQIGDKCTISTNCSSTADRLCDVTQPGGYCTVFNCEPGSCPDDSVCVNFGTELSRVPNCAPSQANSPYKRSFCMADCSSDSDCRDGYRCLEPRDDCASHESCFNAVLAEHQTGKKVCAVPENGDPPPNTSNQVCLGAGGGGGSSSTGGSGGGTAEGGSAGTAEGGSAGESGSGAVESGGSGGNESSSGGTGG